jgi:hypothetical protein
MWNKPSNDELSRLPIFYETEKIPLKERIVYMHFFVGGSDWYVVEWDLYSHIFFGFVILNNDYEMAEWGYFSFEELCGLKVKFIEVDRDLYFTPKKAVEIEKIKKAQGW